MLWYIQEIYMAGCCPPMCYLPDSCFVRNVSPSDSISLLLGLLTLLTSIGLQF